MKLNIGCGTDIREEYINIDKYPHDERVVRCDINIEPLPFKTESVSEIICHQTIEHLNNPEFAINEMQRVLKKGGKLSVSIPTYSYTFCHKRPRNTRNTFDVLFHNTTTNPSYVDSNFQLVRCYGTRNANLLLWILFRIKTKIQDFIDTTLHQHLVWDLVKK